MLTLKQLADSLPQVWTTYVQREPIIVDIMDMELVSSVYYPRTF
jgi:hypothetical protein